jgi:prepilin-type N-terminal cleavage/methylation domain-containing protein
MPSTQRRESAETGFSLVELMVAITITLVVSGAIYGLLTAGNSAFRREPNIADRQQNVRIAMDLIAKDVAAAGVGFPLVSQVFTHTDDPSTGSPLLNGAGPQGVLGAAGQAERGAPPTGTGTDTSDNTDVLEILAADEQCPGFTMCKGPNDGSASTGAATMEPPGGCLLASGPGFVLLDDTWVFSIHAATPKTPAGVCSTSAGVVNAQFDLQAAFSEWKAPRPITSAGAGIVAFLYPAKVIRYMIANNIDPSDSAPALWRSETGRYKSDGSLEATPAANNHWTLVARGIDDLQVEYMNGGGLWSNSPGTISPCPAGGCAAPADYNKVIRRVRVTLSSRATDVGASAGAMRGELVSVIASRVAVTGLQAVGQFR